MPAEPPRLRGRAVGRGRRGQDRPLQRDVPGQGRRPLRHLAGRGIRHHRGGRRADPRGTSNLAPGDHHRRLRDCRRHPGPSQLRRRRGVPRRRVRPPRVRLDTPVVHADLCPRAGRPRTPGLSDRPRPAPRGDHGRAHRTPTGPPRAHRLPAVQGPRHRVPPGRRRHPVPRTRHPGRLWRALPFHRARVLRLLRSVGGGRHRAPRRAAPRRRHGAGRRLAAVRHLLCGHPALGRPGRCPAPVGQPGGPGRTGGAAMTEDSGGRRTIAVEGISRVEGEGSLRVDVRDGVVDGVALTIFEPPRFFEALLRGRQSTESPDITARICGICPVAYQMSACAAVEDACGVTVDQRITALRRLLYYGEWIQSHALHIYRLHAPDFLGCADAVELAERDRAAVERGLALKRTGNLIMETVGGRAIHPVNVRVGGFYRAPTVEQVAAMVEPLQRALEAALATVAWVGSFEFPDVEGAYRFVSLRHDGRYPIESGRVASSDGMDLSPADFADVVIEEHVARSTALHARLEGRLDYLTGPLARYALNATELPEVARQAAADAGLGATVTTPFRSIVVRAVELVFACH